MTIRDPNVSSLSSPMSDPQRLKDIQARVQSLRRPLTFVSPEFKGTAAMAQRSQDAIADDLEYLLSLVHAQAQQIAKLERIVEIEHRAYTRLNLCSDHRDKANGLCIVCQAEARTKLEQVQQIEALQGELRQIDQVLARRPAVATEPTRASAVEKACFVAGQQSDRANRLEHEVERLKRQIVPLPDPPVASPPIADLPHTENNQ